MKKYIIVAIVILALVVGYTIYQRRSKKQYLLDWANTDTGNSRDLRIAAINKMTSGEIDTLYLIVRDYFNSPLWGQNGATLPSNLQDAWNALHLKYGSPF